VLVADIRDGSEDGAANSSATDSGEAAPIDGLAEASGTLHNVSVKLGSLRVPNILFFCVVSWFLSLGGAFSPGLLLL